MPDRRWTLLVCGNCGEHGTVDRADEGDAHCSACDQWMNTEAVEVVAVDALLSDEAVKAWNQATRAHRHAAHALWASTSPDDYEAGIRGVLEAASTGERHV